MSTAFPQPFGAYTLVSRLGVGGMAITYRGTKVQQDGSELHLAIKCMLPHLLTNQQFVQLFIEEARTAVRLTHPNIVRVTDFGDVNGQLFLAMDFVHGHSLAAVLERARKVGAQALPRAEALFLGCVLCEALNYAHTKAGVVHRDIAPDNLLLGYDGVPKLIDFGIAKSLGELPNRKRAVAGKYRYASPEAARGEPVDQRTDVYSAAVVVYEMLTGKRPYDGDPFEVMRMSFEGKAPPPSSFDAGLATLDQVLLEAMHPVRGKRTRSVHLLLGQLYEALVTLAPEFDAGDLKHLMGFLFDKELTELHHGKKPRIPMRYSMRAEDWVGHRPEPMATWPGGQQPLAQALGMDEAPSETSVHVAVQEKSPTSDNLEPIEDEKPETD